LGKFFAVYLSFYSLDKKPFQINPEPNFLWLGEIHKEALSILRYGVISRNGVLTLTGDIGTGKTTLINALLSELNSNVTAAHISYTSIDIIGFLNLVGQAFQITESFDRAENFIYLFSKFLHKKFNENVHVLLVVDEAHRLSWEIFEQIRLLSNIEIAGQNLISFFLIGQNELNKKLLSRDCRAPRQRITIHYQLKPLSETETLQYCNYRLKVAGSQFEIFTSQAIHEIYRFSRGYPRLINIICEQALIAGYVKEAREIAPEIIKNCSRELRLPGEIKILLKFDFNRKLSTAGHLISRLDLRSKIRAIFFQLKKYTLLLSRYPVDRFKRGGLYIRLKNSVMMELHTAVDSFRLSEKYTNLTIQSSGNNKNLFLKTYGLKRKIQNFISRLTDSGLKNNTLAVGSLILALTLFFWYQAILTSESNPMLSENLAEHSKLPPKGAAEEHAALLPDLNGIDTAAKIEAVKKPHVNLELTRPNSIGKITMLDRKIHFNQKVDPMDYKDEIKYFGSIENNYDKNQFDHVDKDEKVYPGKIPGTESSKIKSDEAQLSARELTNIGQQDSVKSNSLRGFSNSSRTIYSVQIGAFLSSKNAIRRVAILEKKGYLTNIVKFRDAKGRIWYTVRVGAYDSISAARKKAKILSSKENLKTIVRRSDRL
jgi:type II secretory pathway predicted ATPase ExeA